MYKQQNEKKTTRLGNYRDKPRQIQTNPDKSRRIQTNPDNSRQALTKFNDLNCAGLDRGGAIQRAEGDKAGQPGKDQHLTYVYIDVSMNMNFFIKMNIIYSIITMMH